MAAARRVRKSATAKSPSVAFRVQDEEKLPAGPFLPPGFEPNKPPAEGTGDLVTYFLHTEKRGIKPYLEAAVKSEQHGFRAVLVTRAPIIFDRRSARVAGRLAGDQFDLAKEWAQRSILDELHLRYVLSGGGTPKERERVAVRFFKAMKARDEIVEKLRKAEKALEDCSVEMVLRYGKKPIVLDHQTLDACSGPGDKVFWRSRRGGSVE